MIESGFNGITDINFNKVSEDYLLENISCKKIYSKLLSSIYHRDTQEKKESWRIQGRIKKEDFISSIGVQSITLEGFKISTDGEDNFLITFYINKPYKL